MTTINSSSSHVFMDLEAGIDRWKWVRLEDTIIIFCINFYNLIFSLHQLQFFISLCIVYINTNFHTKTLMFIFIFLEKLCTPIMHTYTIKSFGIYSLLNIYSGTYYPFFSYIKYFKICIFQTSKIKILF